MVGYDRGNSSLCSIHLRGDQSGLLSSGISLRSAPFLHLDRAPGGGPCVGLQSLAEPCKCFTNHIVRVRIEPQPGAVVQPQNPLCQRAKGIIPEGCSCLLPWPLKFGASLVLGYWSLDFYHLCAFAPFTASFR